MRKILYGLLILFLFNILFFNSVYAQNIQTIEYKSLKNGTKIKYSDCFWTNKVKKRDTDYFIRSVDRLNFDTITYLSKDGETKIVSDWYYDFIYKGRLIGYSHNDMNFYEIIYYNDAFQTRMLSIDEVQELFPDFKLVKLSSFNKYTNSLRIKKNKLHEKIILINDINVNLANHIFTSGNAKFQKYIFPNFIKINSKGMLHFSEYGESTKNANWFVLLVK